MRAHRARTRPSAASRSCRRSRCRVTRRRRSRPTRSSASTASRSAAVPADWGIYPNLFNVEDATFAFLEDVLREVMELFPGQYIHVGGDEAVKDQWQSSPRVQAADARARHRGRARAAELVRAAHRTLPRRERPAADRLGRDPRRRPRAGCHRDVLARASTARSPRPRRATMRCCRRGPRCTSTTARAPAPTEPPGRGRVIDLEDVYRFDPMPPALASRAARHILGVQANLWTEHIRTEDRAAVDGVSARRGRGGGRLVARRAARLCGFPASADARSRLVPGSRAHGGRLVVSRRGRAAAPNHASQPGARAPVQRQAGAQSRGRRAAARDARGLPGRHHEPVLDLRSARTCRGSRRSPRRSGRCRSISRSATTRDDPAAPAARRPEGELEMRLDGCDGELIASLPLAPAVASDAVTRLPPAAIQPRAGTHDLCLTFTGRGIDPMWAIDSIELARREYADDALSRCMSPLSGWAMPLDEVPDAVFAQRHAGRRRRDRPDLRHPACALRRRTDLGRADRARRDAARRHRRRAPDARRHRHGRAQGRGLRGAGRGGQAGGGGRAADQVRSRRRRAPGAEPGHAGARDERRAFRNRPQAARPCRRAGRAADGAARDRRRSAARRRRRTRRPPACGCACRCRTASMRGPRR